MLTSDKSSSDDDGDNDIDIDFAQNPMASPVETAVGKGSQQPQSRNTLLDAQNEQIEKGNVSTSEQIWDFQRQVDHLTRPHEMEIDTNVDEMKIQTMYKMVEDCKVSVIGNEVVKRILYLTNKQAVLFDEVAMERCIQALDIGDPKFVINLLPSVGVRSQNDISHTELDKTRLKEYEGSQYQTSELNEFDERATETQILMFMRTCILPIAKQTRALILVSGANDCYLGAALANVALAEQARLGKDCPFTVVAMASEYEVHYNACSSEKGKSLAAQLARGSKAWQSRLAVTDYHWKKKGPDFFQHCDLTPAASHYVIFESLDERDGSKQFGPKRAFESIFLTSMTRKVPSIAIQSHFCDNGLSVLSALTARGIPVLVLDSRERAITADKFASEMTTTLAKEANAFPIVTRERLQRIAVVDDVVTVAGRKEIVRIAEEMMERQWKCFIDRGVTDHLDTARISFFHSVLHLGAEHSESHNSGLSLGHRIRELEKFERANKDAKKSSVPPEIANQVISYLQTRSEALASRAQFSRVQKWLKSHDEDVKHLEEEAEEYMQVMKQTCDEIDQLGDILPAEVSPTDWLAQYDFFTSPFAYSGSVFDIEDLKQTLTSVAKTDRLPSSDSLETLRQLRNAWDHVEIYHNIADHYKLITKLTYTILLAIGIAVTGLSLCDTILMFHSRSVIMALSFFGTAVVGYVTFTNPAMKWQQLRMAALAIESNIWFYRTRAGAYRTLGEGFEDSAEKILKEVIQDIKTVVLEGADVKSTSFYSISLSQNKHGQYDDAALTEMRLAAKKKDGSTSNLWSKKRDAENVSGVFHDMEMSSILEPSEISQNLGNAPQFQEYLKRIHGDANLSEIPLTDVVRWLRRRGGMKTSPHLEYDSHYEPVQPDAYIHFRLNKVLAFYRGRIPRCNRIRNVAQVLLVLGSIGTGALAYADLSPWAAAVSIVASAITAYLEFHGTNSKMTRYSATVHALESLKTWWETLPQIDRSVVQNIDNLVRVCEDSLQQEQQSWRSTSQAARMLQKQAQGHANSGQSGDSS